MLLGAGRMWGCAPGLGALPIELPPGSPQADRTRTCNLPISSGNRRGFDSPGTQQHDEPTAEHHCETAGGIEPPCAVLQTATSATRSCGHAVMRGLRTIRTSVCFLGGSHAVPCTMSPGRFQQDSNLRCRLRRVASYPLDHGSIVREEGIEPSVPRRRGYGPQSTPPAQLARGVNNGYRAHISGATTRRSATELYPPRCPIDVPTAGPPRCERGALPLS
jgi:hypothetical protein